MRNFLARCRSWPTKVAAPMLAVSVVCAGAHLAALPEPGARHATASYVLAATVDTDSSAVGVAESNLYFMSTDELETAMDSLVSLGVTQIRIFVPWRDIEATEDEYDWSSLDAVVAAASERGIAVTASVTSTPTWASNYGYITTNGQPSDYSDYAEFVGALAERYGASANDGNQLISAYEIWNEPNGYAGWSPTPSAEEYTELLKAAYTAIKAADPDATVIGGVVGSGTSLGTDTINAVDFIEQMYANGAQGYFDALSIHPYNLTTTFSEGEGWADSAIEQVKAIRSLMDANGDDDKLIWATEYGMPTTGGYTAAEQSAYLQDFLEAWSSLTGVGPMFIYSLVDQDTGDGNIEDNWGLYTDDWTAKDAAAVVAAWLAANPTLAEAAYTPTFPTETAATGSLLSQFIANLQKLATTVAATIGTAFGTVWANLTSIKTAVTAVISGLTQVLSNLQNNIQNALNGGGSSATTTASTDATATTVAAGAMSVVETVTTAAATSATADTKTSTGTEVAATSKSAAAEADQSEAATKTATETAVETPAETPDSKAASVDESASAESTQSSSPATTTKESDAATSPEPSATQGTSTTKTTADDDSDPSSNTAKPAKPAKKPKKAHTPKIASEPSAKRDSSDEKSGEPNHHRPAESHRTAPATAAKDGTDV